MSYHLIAFIGVLPSKMENCGKLKKIFLIETSPNIIYLNIQPSSSDHRAAHTAEALNMRDSPPPSEQGT